MLKSFADAFRGIFLLIKSERNFQIHIVALICVCAAGFYFEINRFEWIVIVLTSALVLGLESVNSALEKLCDEVTEERKESIRTIKDTAAGAVLIGAIAAVVVAALIFSRYV
jgi:diacylglycerol kinase